MSEWAGNWVVGYMEYIKGKQDVLIMFLVLLTNCELWQHDNNGAWPGQKHESWPFYSLKGTWKSDDYCTRYKSHPNPSQANLFMKHVAGISQKLKHGRARLPPGSTDECMKAQEYSLFRLTTAGGSRSTAQIVGWKHDGTGNLPHWTDQSAAAHKYDRVSWMKAWWLEYSLVGRLDSWNPFGT